MLGKTTRILASLAVAMSSVPLSKVLTTYQQLGDDAVSK